MCKDLDPHAARARGTARLGLCLWAGAALLAGNCALLAAVPARGTAYLANLLLHPVLGLALAAPFVLWWRRQRRPALVPGVVLLVAAGSAGLLLVIAGNRGATRPLLWAHAGLAVAGLAGLLAAGRHRPWSRPYRVSLVGFALALALPLGSRLLRVHESDRAAAFVNSPPPPTLAAEAMGGAAGPFYPSSLHTRSGARWSPSDLTPARGCGRSGCHPAELAEWSASAHRYSGLDNPWYRRSFEQARQERGGVAARWCGGCHTPALLVTGLMDRPPAEVAKAAAATAGVSCTFCHSVSRIRSTMGQADLELDRPPLLLRLGGFGRLGELTEDLLLRLDPEPHRRAFAAARAGTAAAALCAACHKAHVDGPLNGRRWTSVMNDFDSWQASSVSGQSTTQSLSLPRPRGCVDCHMPLLSAGDGGAGDGRARSHRFAAANTALPAWRGDRRQQQAVIDFLQAGSIRIDFFAMSVGRPAELAGEPPELMVMTPAEPVYAPLDRLPVSLRRGESNRLDVVLHGHGLGHDFPGGKAVLEDCWVELDAVDEHGRTLFASAAETAAVPADRRGHRLGGLWIDGDSRPVERDRFWTNRAAVFVNRIEPGASHVVRFRLAVPPDAGTRVTLAARLQYRKFRPEITQWVFAAAGSIPPPLPVVTVAAGSITLPVAAPGAARPELLHPAALSDRDAERWHEYGQALAKQRDFFAAESALRSLVQQRPDDAGSWTTLGQIYLRMGNLAQARAALARALTLAPRLARAHYFLGLVEQQERHHGPALAHLELAAAQYPQELSIWREIGRTRLLAADYAGALRAFDRALAINPENDSAHLLMSMAAQAQGNHGLARLHQLLFQRFKPDHGDANMAAVFAERNAAGLEALPRHEHRSAPAGISGAAPRTGGGGSGG